MLVLIYLPRKTENRISLNGKEGLTNIQISAKPVVQHGILCLEDRDLPTAIFLKAKIVLHVPTHSFDHEPRYQAM